MNIKNYFESYKTQLNDAFDTINQNDLERASNVIIQAARLGIPILVFGNGGSAAISEHFSCDHTKGIRHDTHLEPNMISLTSNFPLISAIANDYSYEDIFSEQIKHYVKNNLYLLVLAISSSGNSPNIIKALETAKTHQLQSIAIVGFDGGKVREKGLADIVIHIDAKNYGIVEDITQSLCHIMAQHIRLEYGAAAGSIKL